MSRTQIHSIRDMSPFLLISRYTASCIASSFESVPAEHDIRYSWEMKRGRVLPFQRISEVGERSPCDVDQLLVREQFAEPSYL